MQPITISEVTVSFDDFVYLNRQLTGKRRLLLLAFSPLLVGYVMWQNSADAALWSTTNIIWYVLVLGGMIALQLYGIRRAVRRTYDNSRSFLAPTTYILSEEGLNIFSAAVTSQIQWAAIRRAQVVGNWCFLQTTSNGFFVDSRCVQPPASPADVTALLRSRGLLS